MTRQKTCSIENVVARLERVERGIVYTIDGNQGGGGRCGGRAQIIAVLEVNAIGTSSY